MLPHPFVIIGTVVWAFIGTRLSHDFDISPWLCTVLLLGVGVVLHFVNARLIVYYIEKNAPELAKPETWELTAGTGIVPRWVSLIGLAGGVGAILGSVFPYLHELAFRSFESSALSFAILVGLYALTYLVAGIPLNAMAMHWVRAQLSRSTPGDTI